LFRCGDPERVLSEDRIVLSACRNEDFEDLIADTSGGARTTPSNGLIDRTDDGFVPDRLHRRRIRPARRFRSHEPHVRVIVSLSDRNL
jgi:hypothetical protein